MKFTAARTSVYGTFVIGVAVVTLLEMPVLHLLLHRSSWWVHALIVAANAGALVWIFRERARMKTAVLTLDADALAVSLPGKWRGARDRLLACANKIVDASLRESFLARVPENARIMELARAWL